MKRITVNIQSAFVQGALSASRVGDALYPCRLPEHRRHWFPSPNDSLMQKARCTSGVRLRLETDATALTLRFDPLPAPQRVVPNGHAFDAVIDNRIVRTVFGGDGATEAVFDHIGRGRRTIELWLPPTTAVGLRDLTGLGASVLRPMPDRRPLWVTWGSSLTHCVRAGSAARVWPATVARRHDLNLLSLGFGGDCLLEPMVAMTIRDLPARYISMKLGINAVSTNLSARTYPALVTAAVSIVREKHPHTPLALISPMSSAPRETTPTATGYTLARMREDMKAVHAALTAAGDLNLYYVDGLAFFGHEDIARYTVDQLHPNAEGIDLQADRFSDLVMPLLLGGGNEASSPRQKLARPPRRRQAGGRKRKQPS